MESTYFFWWVWLSAFSWDTQMPFLRALLRYMCRTKKNKRHTEHFLGKLIFFFSFLNGANVTGDHHHRLYSDALAISPSYIFLAVDGWHKNRSAYVDIAWIQSTSNLTTVDTMQRSLMPSACWIAHILFFYYHLLLLLNIYIFFWVVVGCVESLPPRFNPQFNIIVIVVLFTSTLIL